MKEWNPGTLPKTFVSQGTCPSVFGPQGSKYVPSQCQGQLLAEIQVASLGSASVGWEEPCYVQAVLSTVLCAAEQGFAPELGDQDSDTWGIIYLPLATRRFRVLLAEPPKRGSLLFSRPLL